MMILYTTDVNDSQWQVIKEFLNHSRKRKYNLRQVLNGILYVVKTGCQWRLLPKTFPKWQLVYYYFKCWVQEGIIDLIQENLVKMLRSKHGRNTQPSIAIIDAQSVKSTLTSSAKHTGFDGGKKVKGIKRHIVVDTLGHLLEVAIHSANTADRRGAIQVLDKLPKCWPKIAKIYADGGYPQPGKADIKNHLVGGYTLEIAKRTEQNTYPKRWIVERTFAWIDSNRRNSKSYERLPKTAEAITKLSTIRIMIKHL